jgi:hypothetical protein
MCVAWVVAAAVGGRVGDCKQHTGQRAGSLQIHGFVGATYIFAIRLTTGNMWLWHIDYCWPIDYCWCQNCR